MDLNLIENEINNIYSKGQYSLGWRLLNTKKIRLKENNGVVLITLNPGIGKGNYKNHDYNISNENGNSLIHENWISPIKDQLLFLLKCLWENESSKNSFNDFVDNILQGYFIPFRSCSISELAKDNSILSLSMSIWNCIISDNIDKIRTINCIGKNIPYRNIITIIENMNGELISANDYDTGWGNITVSISKYIMRNRRIISIIGFPHLAQFKLFGREISKVQMDRIVYESIIH